MKIAWLHRDDEADPWELWTEKDDWMGGYWIQIVYCIVEK